MIDILVVVAFISAVFGLTTIPFLLHRSMQVQLNNSNTDRESQIRVQIAALKDLQDQVMLVREDVSRMSAQIQVLLEERDK